MTLKETLLSFQENQPIKNILQNFVLLLIENEIFVDYIDRVKTGSTVRHISKDQIDDAPILLPPIETQKRICSILIPIIDLIENLSLENTVLENMARLVYKSWFVDFEKSNQLINSELGKIPRYWDIQTINEIATIEKGFSYKGSEKSENPNGFPFVTLNNIMEGGGFKSEYSWIESSRLKERNFIKESDLIFANTEHTKDGRLLATPSLVYFPYFYKDDKGVFSHHITKIIPKTHDLKFYLYYTLLYKQFELAMALHTGTGVWGFNHEFFLDNYAVLIPPKELQKKFSKFASPLNDKIILNSKQIMNLKTMKESLLPKLLSGEIRV